MEHYEKESLNGKQNTTAMLVLGREKKWDLGENSHLVLSLGEIKNDVTGPN